MFKNALYLIAGILTMAGCTTMRQEPVVNLPPIANPPTGLHNPGQVVWHDLATRDLEMAKAFYGPVFGWTFKQLNETGRQYTEVYLGEALIGGMFTFEAGEKEGAHGEWLISLSSADVSADAATFASMGGKVLGKPRLVPDRGMSAFVEDPQKALMLLVHSSTGDPLEREEVPLGGWLWDELWTHDAEAALSFYNSIFGYEAGEVQNSQAEDYRLLLKNGQPVAGILQMRAQEVRPHWVPFIRVSNVHATIERATGLGAEIIIEPSPDIRDGDVALLLGPTGEPIVIQEFDFERK